ncbi:MAG: 50S ribosomal protein L30 [Acidimicrobiales bacterium]
MAEDLLVVQVRSGIGTKPKHRGTLRALGLHGIGSSNVLPDRREIRGMIARVPHLVRVEQAAARAGDAGVPAAGTGAAAEGTADPEQPPIEES